MVNAAALACAKPGQVLINLGRGPLIEEAALVEALESGRLRGAALDVFDKEPLPSDHVLWKMPNVLLSPHNAVSGGLKEGGLVAGGGRGFIMLSR
jgi:phosphoglycerate dehydrogenase-like enzyme